TVESLIAAAGGDGTAGAAGGDADGTAIGDCAPATAAATEKMTADRRNRFIWFGKTTCSKKQRAPSRGPLPERGRGRRSQAIRMGGTTWYRCRRSRSYRSFRRRASG